MLPSEKDGRARSGCLHVGTFLVIRKTISDYKLDEMITRIIGQDVGLFLEACHSGDKTAYEIVAFIQGKTEGED